MAKKATKNQRVPIPVETQRKLLLECGFKCSMPNCENTHGLEFHHINGDPSDNREENILVLCAVHHSMTEKRGTKLDRKACTLLKETIQTLAIPLSIDKAELQAQWDESIDPSSAPTARVEALESFVANLLATIPGFVVAKTRVRSRFGDIDILLRNESWDPFVSRLADHILVECKSRLAPVGASDVQALLGKLTLEGARTAFLFSTSGFSHDAAATAGDGIRNGLSILLFGPDEIANLIHADDRIQVLKETVSKLVLA